LLLLCVPSLLLAFPSLLGLSLGIFQLLHASLNEQMNEHMVLRRQGSLCSAVLLLLSKALLPHALVSKLNLDVLAVVLGASPDVEALLLKTNHGMERQGHLHKNSPWRSL
jgi:hypothetical protein